MHSAPASCVYFLTNTVNSYFVSPISGILYCYLLIYDDISIGLSIIIYLQGLSLCIFTHALVSTLVSIYHTVSYKSDMRLAFLLMDFFALHPVIVSLFSYTVQPLSLVFSYWHLALLRRIKTPSLAHMHCSLEYLLACLLHTSLVLRYPTILKSTFTLVYMLSTHIHILLQ